MKRISDRVYVEVGFHGSNVGALDGGSGELVLIDAPQLPLDAQRWSSAVAALGTPRFLVNTDHHPDHTIGNRWLAGTVVAHRRTRARLVAEPPALDYLTSLFSKIGPDSVALLDGYKPRLPEVTFDERLELWVGDRHVVLIHAPGHTENTIFVHLPDDGVLFTGDDVCEASLPAFVDTNLSDFFSALDLAESLPFEHLVPGHGEVSDRGLLQHYRELARELIRRIATAVDAGASRDDVGATIRYTDRIHVDVGDHPDYPADLVDHFQRLSVERIYDDLSRDPSLRSR
jgi:cyclase